MMGAIASVLAVAILGSLSVPAIMIMLARVGYFEPISIRVFGRAWDFAPRVKVGPSIARDTQAHKQDSWVMARPVSIALVVLAHVIIVILIVILALWESYLFFGTGLADRASRDLCRYYGRCDDLRLFAVLAFVPLPIIFAIARALRRNFVFNA